MSQRLFTEETTGSFSGKTNIAGFHFTYLPTDGFDYFAGDYVDLLSLLPLTERITITAQVAEGTINVASRFPLAVLAAIDGATQRMVTFETESDDPTAGTRAVIGVEFFVPFTTGGMRLIGGGESYDVAVTCSAGTLTCDIVQSPVASSTVEILEWLTDQLDANSLENVQNSSIFVIPRNTNDEFVHLSAVGDVSVSLDYQDFRSMDNDNFSTSLNPAFYSSFVVISTQDLKNPQIQTGANSLTCYYLK